ncbi:MAG: patatin-like phospholipase family protein [Emcibacter sp.]|nr:patatin-like phospholipase family protein [Emcibacter sp.]
MRKSCFFSFYLMCILSLYLLTGQKTEAYNDDNNASPRPKIGLVLSGGGARGGAHIGILKVLEENHIPIDVIAGTSFGAVVGGLYASGYSADELKDILKDINWQTLLSSRTLRSQRSFKRKQDDNGFLIKFKLGLKEGKLRLPTGLVTTNNLRLYLLNLINNSSGSNNFDNLAIPFKAVATDLETGLAVVLDQGNLVSAMVASMAVPALFPPIEYSDKLLVDGGVANNIPIDVARSMGADIIIAVDVSTALLTKKEISSFTNVIDQLIMIMTKKASVEQLKSLTERDIFIRPDLGDIGLVDFERTLETIPLGKQSAEDHIHKLSQYSLSDQAWQDYISARKSKSNNNPVIDFIHINNNTKISDEIIKARLSIKAGQKLDTTRMSHDLSTIYGLEIFDKIDYAVVKENGQTGVNINVKKPKNGEDHIRFGLALQEDFEGESGFQLAAGYTNLALNNYGGEWQALFKIGDEFGLFTEFYQPIDFADRYHIFANAVGRKYNRNVIDDDGTILSQLRISQALVQMGFGRNFDQWATARIGLQRSFGDIRGRIGFPIDSSKAFDQTTLSMSFTIDTIDNVRFPHKGIFLEALYTNNLPWLDGDNSVDTISSNGFLPLSWGDNTLGFNYHFTTAFNDTLDETGLVPLGGFMRLTAYSPGQITGNHGGSLAAVYYRKIAGGGSFLAQMPIFVGGTIEAGNLWNRRQDMSLNDLHWSSSLFVGADSLIGPIYLGAGIGDGGQTSVFLFVGQLF